MSVYCTYNYFYLKTPKHAYIDGFNRDKLIDGPNYKCIAEMFWIKRPSKCINVFLLKSYVSGLFFLGVEVWL